MTITLAHEAHVPGRALRGARRWLYAGDDPAFELPGLERISTADAVMAQARELREPYLDTIGSLSVRNASPEWWATYLATKHLYPSLFARICALAAARELVRDGTLVVCSTSAQLDALRDMLGGRSVGTLAANVRRRGPAVALRASWPAMRAIGEHAPAAFRRVAGAAHPFVRTSLERTDGHRRRALQALGAQPLPPLSGESTALMISWLDDRCFGSDGRFEDSQLGSLGRMLGDRGWRVATLLKPLLSAPFETGVRALMAQADPDEPVALTDSYLTATDWLACQRRVRRTRVDVPADLRIGEVPCEPMMREYLRDHDRSQVEALSHEPLVKALALAGMSPELIVIPWEGHAWEHVLCDAVRRHMPETKVVGYDNLNFSSLALSLYPSPNELGVRPLPDRVVTNGETFAEILGRSSFPRERIRVGCALRHSRLTTMAGREHRADEFVLAAGSIDSGQTVELLRTAWEAFGDQLVARLHPASEHRVIRAALPQELRYAPEPLSDLLSAARMMLYTYSVVPYEALAAGVPPVFVRSETLLDLDQLEPTPDVRWVARTPDELRAVAAEIAAMADRAGWERRAHEVVRSALAPPTASCADAFVGRD